MCGIVGYIGAQEATSILLAGLRELEYRGYDSAGIALLEAGGLRVFKAVGKLDNLVKPRWVTIVLRGRTAIGHTRWATHGKPTEANAHPHGLTHSQVVHNGIIENYLALRDTVDTPFLSQTDSEVIVHLFEQRLAQQQPGLSGALAAFRDTLAALRGAYAILLISETLPGHVFFARWAPHSRLDWRQMVVTSRPRMPPWSACARRRSIWKTVSGAWPH
jgi:glutamine---fructose-6-phosphate transaminase (isomerizing)